MSTQYERERERYRERASGWSEERLQKERWLRDITKEKMSEEYHWKKKGSDQKSAL